MCYALPSLRPPSRSPWALVLHAPVEQKHQDTRPRVKPGATEYQARHDKLNRRLPFPRPLLTRLLCRAGRPARHRPSDAANIFSCADAPDDKKDPAWPCMGGLDPILIKDIGPYPLNLVDTCVSPPPSEDDPNGFSCWLKTQPTSHEPSRVNGIAVIS